MQTHKNLIEDNIYASAERLFCKYEYDEVSMKMIAQEANIAVGTLYNYYFDKTSLYLTVVKKNWQSTFDTLIASKNDELSFEEQFRCYLTHLYNDSTHRHGLGFTIKNLKNIEKDRFQKIHDSIQIRLHFIFESLTPQLLWEADDEILSKLAYSLLSNLYILIEYYPETPQQNIDFLYHSLISFFKL